MSDLVNGTEFFLGANAANSFVIGPQGLNPSIEIGSSGELSFPSWPAFDSFLTGNLLVRLADTAKIVFDGARGNSGGHYNPETGDFKAPQNGFYHFDSSFFYDYDPQTPVVNGMTLSLLIGSHRYEKLCRRVYSNYGIVCSLSNTVYMKASQLARIVLGSLQGPIEGTLWASQTYFSGHKVS